MEVATGPAHALDARRHPFRADLAAEHLRGLVTAPRYANGRKMQLAAPVTPFRSRPDLEADAVSEGLFGEHVTVYDDTAGWAWVQLATDGYMGYVPSACLAEIGPDATHRVGALATFIYPAADIKSPPRACLSLGSVVAVHRAPLEGERFAEIAGGGFVIQRHLTGIGRGVRDYVDVAEMLIGTPYLWGGRSRHGIDCSGLVQLALTQAEHACPRDSDMQEVELGHDVLVPVDLEGLTRGDLVFWRGHVGIMTCGIMMVHANAHHMAVACEPLATAVDRISKATGNGISRIRRLTPITS